MNKGFFNFYSFKSKIKGMYENHNSLFLITCIAIITILLGGLFVHTSLTPKTYKSSDFVSSVVQTPEKKISNRADVNGIFTYGPYINLDKGQYNITLNYSSTKEQKFEITYGNGGLYIYDNILPAGENSKTFKFNVPENISDKSVEIRTYYNGKGAFYLKSVQLEPLKKSFIPLLYVLCFVLSSLLCFFVFRSGKKLRGLAIGYIAFHYIVLYPIMSKGLISIGLTFLVATVMTFAVNFRLEIVSYGIKNLEKPVEIICTLLSSYLFTSGLIILLNSESFSNINFAGNVDFPNLILEILIIFNVLIFMRILFFSKKFTYVLTEVSAVFLGFELITHITERNIYFTMGVVAIIGFITYYLCKHNHLTITITKLNDTFAFIFITVLFLFFCGYFSTILIAKYRGFCSPTFDFGIFSQMFGSMVKTGIQYTTVERNELLSHFAVHCSPIWYLMLPFYLVFRTPETLLVCQVVLIGLGVYPVYLLCRQKSDNIPIAIIICIIYLATPAMICPMYYDVHETCFLPFLILFLMYFIETKKWRMAFLFTLLVLLVKEDSALYIVPIALYLITAKKEYKRGIVLCFIAVVYFALAYSLVNSSGHDVVAARYGIYCLPGEEGTMPMFKNIIRDPGFLLQTMFHEDMLTFVLYTMGVLLFIPLMGKKFSNLFLLLPFLFMHLATNYQYQHEVGYQYTFGPCALVFFLFILNIYRYPKKIAYGFAITALIGSCFATYTYKGKLNYFTEYYLSNKEVFDETELMLKKVPSDVTVIASDFLTAHLPQVKDMYIYPYDDGDMPDYYILQPSYIDNFDDVEEDILSEGYKVLDETDFVTIYAKKDAKPLND